VPIEYLGSRRLFVPLIACIVDQLQPAWTVLDLFSGKSRAAVRAMSKAD
jgi:hypothetical protein